MSARLSIGAQLPWSCAALEFDVASALHSPPRLITLALIEAVAFDTYDFVKRMTGVGMPELQADRDQKQS